MKLEFTEQDVKKVKSAIGKWLLENPDPIGILEEFEGILNAQKNAINAVLSEKLKDAPRVYGLAGHEFEIMRRTPATNATHTAVLVNIEPIKPDCPACTGTGNIHKNCILR